MSPSRPNSARFLRALLLIAVFQTCIGTASAYWHTLKTDNFTVYYKKGD